MAGRMFEGKVAIVTGGALGMGRATARRFAEEGARVCVADIDLKGAEDTVAAIREAGDEAFACPVDIALEDDNDRMVAKTIDRYGRLDLAHLTAAILGERTDFFEGSVENYDRVIAVNLRGCYLGLRSVGRVMPRGGAVVAMSSTAGLKGWNRNVPYSASKHAIIGLVRSAAPAFAAKGLGSTPSAPARSVRACPAPIRPRRDRPGRKPREAGLRRPGDAAARCRAGALFCLEPRGLHHRRGPYRRRRNNVGVRQLNSVSRITSFTICNMCSNHRAGRIEP
jgi:NAD(P)-dependent dehydrogenase (short-subunit alcohol dehydrogenase family)